MRRPHLLRYLGFGIALGVLLALFGTPLATARLIHVLISSLTIGCMSALATTILHLLSDRFELLMLIGALTGGIIGWFTPVLQPISQSFISLPGSAITSGILIALVYSFAYARQGAVEGRQNPSWPQRIEGGVVFSILLLPFGSLAATAPAAQLSPQWSLSIYGVIVGAVVTYVSDI